MRVTKINLDKFQQNGSVRNSRQAVSFKDEEDSVEFSDKELKLPECLECPECEPSSSCPPCEPCPPCTPSQPCPPKASAAKKWGVGIASFCVPGLGQLINGETAKGFAFFGPTLGIILIPGLIADKTKGTGLLPLFAFWGIKLWSIVDAVKNAKSDCPRK